MSIQKAPRDLFDAVVAKLSPLDSFIRLLDDERLTEI